MESDKGPKDGLKQIVLQELADLGLEDLVVKTIRETVADIVRSTLLGLAGGTGSCGPVCAETPPLDEPTPEVTGSPGPAIYIYGVAEGRGNARFGPAGIGQAEVYTISHGGLLAVVHDCLPEPYESKDDEQVKQWLFTQQNVLDMAHDKFGTVLPLGFNTIIHTGGEHPVQTLKRWLEEESTRLRELFERVRGKHEYGIQVFVDDETLKRSVFEENPRFQELKREMELKPEGARFMYRQTLEKSAKEALEEACERCFREVYEAALAVSEDVEVEKIKKPEDGRRMMVNLSCLLPEEKVEELSGVLAKINDREGFQVRFTGPWPPYSFVNSLKIACKESIPA